MKQKINLGDKVRIIAQNSNQGKIGQITAIGLLEKDHQHFRCDFGDTWSWYNDNEVHVLSPVEEVLMELEKATRKFPTWPTDPLHAVAILGEEFGELTKAVLQSTYEPYKVSYDDVRNEALQTAAMALRFLMSLEKYEYLPCQQHNIEIP